MDFEKFFEDLQKLDKTKRDAETISPDYIEKKAAEVVNIPELQQKARAGLDAILADF